MNRLKEFRELAGVNQANLAAACGWPKANSRISRYETTSRTVNIDDANTIVSALNGLGVECSLDTVFSSNEANG